MDCITGCINFVPAINALARVAATRPNLQLAGKRRFPCACHAHPLNKRRKQQSFVALTQLPISSLLPQRIKQALYIVTQPQDCQHLFPVMRLVMQKRMASPQAPATCHLPPATCHLPLATHHAPQLTALRTCRLFAHDTCPMAPYALAMITPVMCGIVRYCLGQPPCPRHAHLPRNARPAFNHAIFSSCAFLA